ncbi:hypothetical protein [Gehongia tenuis]|uniref:Gram-positive cocci surface proteins LPxTG domain-containing protein n=1 Tax=Gehongia tenuis TaxID=2763655 RepID=A0A926D478_9FIRM|nr:hypothetical protein [Gehongia tenuis]MBC8530951.1 hypothetical protein [Gehongia tenuis]
MKRKKKGLLAMTLCAVMAFTAFGGVAFAEGLGAGSASEPTLGASLEPSPSEDTLEEGSPSASAEPSPGAKPSPSAGAGPLPHVSMGTPPAGEGPQPGLMTVPGARNGGVNTPEDFVAALNAGAETIDLSGNIALSSTATITNPVRINLNGFTLSTAGRSKVLSIGADVTIQGPGTISCGDGTSSGPTSSNVVIQVSRGTLTLNNTTVEAGATTGSSSTSQASGGIWLSTGNIILNESKVVGGAYSGPGGEGGYGIWLQGTATRLEAANSTITGGSGTDTSTTDFGSNQAGGGAAIQTSSGDKTVILTNCAVTGGQITSKNKKNANGNGGAAVRMQSGVYLEVTGGTLCGGSTVNAGTGGTGVWLQSGGTMVIKNASVSGGEGANLGEGGTGVLCQSGAMDIKIENTSVKGGDAYDDYAGTALFTGGQNTSGTIKVVGGGVSAGNGPAWSAAPFGVDMQTNASSVQISVTLDDAVVSGGDSGAAVGISAAALDGGKLKLTDSQTQGTVRVGSEGATVEQLKKLAGNTQSVFTDENGNAQFGGKPAGAVEDLRPVYNETAGTYHGTLAEALIEAGPGDTIKLLQSMDLSDAGVLNVSGLTIDLNGKTISAENFTLFFEGSDFILKNGTFDSKGGSYALFIGDESVTDNVIVDGVTLLGGINVYNATNVRLRNVEVTGTLHYAVWCDEGGQVTIESGTFKTNGVAVLGMTEPATDSVLNIEDGTFITNGKPLVLEDGDKWGDPAIKGGTFTVDVSGYLAPGYEIIPGADGTYGVQKHNHSWLAAWTSDETHHWHECGGAACSAANSEKDGYGPHTADGGTVTLEPTAADKGLRTYACTVCKRVLRTEEIPALGHAHSYDGWRFDENGHWKVCSCGETAERGAHTYGAWRTTKAATSSEMGSRERSCTQCGYKQVAAVPIQTDVPSTGHTGGALLWAALALLVSAGLPGAVLYGRRAKSRK